MCSLNKYEMRISTKITMYSAYTKVVIGKPQLYATLVISNVKHKFIVRHNERIERKRHLH
jgi:hypothetical protein